jgi:hypothetical protein
MSINFQSYKPKALQVWKWLVSKDMLIFLMFVGLVTIIWWGRTMSSSLRESKITIDINYSGVEDCILFSTPLPSQIQITVSDEGRNLRQLAKQHIGITLDLTNYFSEKQGYITLSTDFLLPHLQKVLPSTAIVENIDLETNEFKYQYQSTKIVPVILHYDVQCANQHQLMGKPILSMDSVAIFGTDFVLSGINSLHTDTIRITNLQDTLSQRVNLSIPNNTRSKASSVLVTFQAEQFTDKSFDIPIHVQDVPANERVQLFPETTTITVRVGVSSYAQVEASDLTAICQYPQEECDVLPIQIQTDNPYISNIRSYPSTVEYIIEK